MVFLSWAGLRNSLSPRLHTKQQLAHSEVLRELWSIWEIRDEWGKWLKAEEAFQAQLLADHPVLHTIELSSENKGRKIMWREPLPASLLPYLYCTTSEDNILLWHITSAQKLSQYIKYSCVPLEATSGLHGYFYGILIWLIQFHLKFVAEALIIRMDKTEIRIPLESCSSAKQTCW